VEIASDGPGRVAVTAPRLVFPEVLDPEQHVAELGSFVADGAGSWVADGPARLVIAGTFGDLAFDVVRDPASQVRVVREGGGQRQELVLPPDASGAAETVSVPSSRSTLTSQRLSLLRPFSVPEGAYVAIGPTEVDSQQGRVSSSALLRAGLVSAAIGWGLVALAAAVVLACWAAGRVLLRRDDAPPLALSLALGAGGLLIAVNGLAYWLPMRAVASIVVIALAATSLLLRGRRGEGLRSSFAREVRQVLRLLAVALVPTAVAFWPVFSWGGWAAGGFKTDLYEYSSLSSLLVDESMISLRGSDQAAASGNVTSGAGFVWRSIDSAAASFLSTTFSLPTITGFVLLGLVLFLVFAVTLLSAADRWSRLSTAMVFVALLNPLLSSLYLENYVSQYFFITLVPAFVLSLAYVWTSPAPVPAQLWALAAICASLVAIYPYFFVVALAGCAVVLVTSPGWWAALRRLAIPVGVATLLAANLALLTVINYSQTRRFEAGLDQIARFWLLQGWSRVEIVEMLMGVRSYHWRSSLGSVDGLDTALQWSIGQWSRSVSPSTPWALALVGGLLLVGAAVSLRSLLRLEVRLMSAVVLGFAIFAVLFAARDQTYVALKAAWSAAALAPALLPLVRVRARFEPVAVLGLAAIAVVWFVTLQADRIAWQLPLSSSWTRGQHVALVPDLDQLANQLGEDEGEAALLTRGEQPLEGSDRDRTLAAFSVVLMRDAGVDCLNCLGTSIPEGLTCPTSPLSTVVTVGVDGNEDRCTLPLGAVGAFYSRYEP
jgi:hypothetical protein